MMSTNCLTKFLTVNKFWISLLSFFILASGLIAQKQIPPKSDRLVNDFAGMLSSGELETLENKLVAYNDSTSTQIAIVIERSLEGDDAFDYTIRLAEAWGIGREGKDNGVLIYIAQDDRKVRIQTGYGMEGFLTDAMSKRIIENVIVPNFRGGQYYKGLDRATELIIQLGSGEFTSDEISGMGEGKIPVGLVIFIIILIIVVIIVLSNMGGGGGYYRGGKYDDHRGGGWIIFGPGSGGGGGWSGGGGGGFGGFGGGSFGGGGAGGSW